MLLVLVYMATLSQVSVYGRETFQNNVIASHPGCPIKFHGTTYNTSYVDFTSTEVAVCFKGRYNITKENDCWVGPRGSIAEGNWAETHSRKDPGSNYHQGVPDLIGSSTCNPNFYFRDSSSTILVIAFRDFGKQSIGYFQNGKSSSTTLIEVIDGVSQVYVMPRMISYRNIGACRQSGALYKLNTTTCHSNGSSVTCSTFSEVTVNPCGGMCNVRCPEPQTCTVTGSTVISFFGNATSIPDRCAYTLISHSGVQLLAVFKDRRRKDVNLLDHVILQMDSPSVNINLGQGGRVQLNNTTLSLSSSPLSRHGVEVYKDQTGVTAKFTLSNYSTSVFFDGYTVQIHLPDTANMTGLCGNSSRPLSEVRTEFSSRSCKMNYSEPADRTINCTRMTERCNLIREAPFTTCHNHIDPEPFITACTNTLCKYPVVDGLSQCRFLEAYVRACKFKTNDTLEGWRSKAGCSTLQAFCQDTLCSAHEFCAENISGGTSCFCRAIFASKYRSTGALGEPTVCDQNSASVSLVGCLLKEKGIDYSELHLNNQSCRGQMDNVTQMVTFKFNASNPCGTVVTAKNRNIIYKNSIMAQNSTNIITRHDQVNIDFSCFYNQPDIKSVAFRIIDSCSNPTDKTVKMVDNGLGTSNYFSFNLFEFSGKSSDVYLHCKVKLCVKKGNTCTQSCGVKRRRRSVRSRYEDGNPAFITMAWTK
nr:PREDICTED: alpha-tectorin-like [Paralichthys olivaceus]